MTDHEAQFMQAYEEYAEAIYRHCYFRVFSRERAKELMQDTFMRAWQYMEEGHTVENLRALLYKIATHAIIDDKRRKHEESLDALLEESPAYEPHEDIRNLEEDKLLLKDIMAELDTLSDNDRRLITLRYVDDLDPKDIAEVLGTTANTISVQLNRVIKKLRGKFSETTN